MAVALQGAAMTNKEGTSYKYKCEFCGELQPGIESAMPSRNAILNRSFKCIKCGKQNKVRIQG